MAIFSQCRLAGTGLLAGLWVAGALAQPQPPAEALLADERSAVERTVLSDARIRELVGPGHPRVIVTPLEPDKAEAEAFLEGRSQAAPTRRVAVVLFDPRANRAARAHVVLPANRILAVERLAAADVPFGPEDGRDALALAKQDAAVRRAVGDTLERYELLEPGSDAPVVFAAQMLPLRSTGPNDPCRAGRCVALIFRTESGYLPFRVHVDLTRRTVQVVQGGGGGHR
jgi:hypothetical protein